MELNELVSMLGYFGTENRRIEHEDCSVVNPVFVFTKPDALPDLHKKPSALTAFSSFDEGMPIFVVATDSSAERIYKNLLTQWNVGGFVYTVNVQSEGQRGVIMNALLHNDLNVDMATFTSWDADYTPIDLDACLVTKPRNIVALSVANDGECGVSQRDGFLYYNMPTSTIVWHYARIKASLRTTTILPYYASAFNLQFLLWLADRGLDFAVLYDKSIPQTDVADYIDADTLHLLRKERPFIFTKVGSVNVKYIHDLAEESKRLLIGGR